jgi:hypothetical protein
MIHHDKQEQAGGERIVSSASIAAILQGVVNVAGVVVGVPAMFAFAHYVVMGGDWLMALIGK